jgi:hypothetical protein
MAALEQLEREPLETLAACFDFGMRVGMCAARPRPDIERLAHKKFLGLETLPLSTPSEVEIG